MHPLIKIQVGLKGLTFVTECQMLDLQLSLRSEVFKEIEPGSFGFQLVVQKCDHIEKEKKARVTVMLNGYERTQDRKVNIVLQKCLLLKELR